MSEDSTIEQDAHSIFGRIRQLAPAHASERAKIGRAPVNVDAVLKKAGYPQRHRENLGTMYGPGFEKAKELWPRIKAGDALVLLFGDRGPGKTQMATWWAAQRVLGGDSAGIYVKCADIFQEIKRTWSDGGKSVGTEYDVLRRYRTAPFLVIDELHEVGGQKSDWGPRTLINMLDHRYDSRKVTVLIANYSLENLTEEVNPSIQSRAEETGCFVNCKWPSYRSRAAAERRGGA